MSVTAELILDDCPSPKTPEDFAQLREQMLVWAKEMEKPDGFTPLAPGSLPGVEMFDRSIGAVATVKSVAVLPVSVATVSAAIINHLKYEDDMISLDVLQEMPETQSEIQVSRWKLTWPVSSREFVVFRSTYSSDGGNKVYVVAFAINTPLAKVDKTYVRGSSKLAWIFEAVEGHCRVTRINAIDPKGWIPTAVVNAKKKDDGARLINLRKALTK